MLWGRHWTELSNVVWCICHYVASVCVLGWTWNLECCTWHCSTGCVQEFVMGVTTLALCPGQALVHNWPFEGPHCAAISCSMTDLCQWLSPMGICTAHRQIHWKYTTISPHGAGQLHPAWLASCHRGGGGLGCIAHLVQWCLMHRLIHLASPMVYRALLHLCQKTRLQKSRQRAKPKKK